MMMFPQHLRGTLFARLRFLFYSCSLFGQYPGHLQVRRRRRRVGFVGVVLHLNSGDQTSTNSSSFSVCRLPVLINPLQHAPNRLGLFASCISFVYIDPIALLILAFFLSSPAAFPPFLKYLYYNDILCSTCRQHRPLAFLGRNANGNLLISCPSFE
jgi:hypothetical protein